MYEKEIEKMEMILKFLKNGTRLEELKNLSAEMLKEDINSKECSQNISKMTMEAIALFLENLAINNVLNDFEDDR